MIYSQDGTPLQSAPAEPPTLWEGDPPDTADLMGYIASIVAHLATAIGVPFAHSIEDAAKAMADQLRKEWYGEYADAAAARAAYDAEEEAEWALADDADAEELAELNHLLDYEEAVARRAAASGTNPIRTDDDPGVIVVANPFGREKS